MTANSGGGQGDGRPTSLCALANNIIELNGPSRHLGDLDH